MRKQVQVLCRVNAPLAARSILSGVILAWARAMGEFGATLMVAGATRFRTETLPIAVYLNISSGELGIAVSCALVLLGAAFILLFATRVMGKGGSSAQMIKDVESVRTQIDRSRE